MATSGQSTLKPLYLILSTQSFLRKQAVDRLIARLNDEGAIDFNLARYDAEKADPEEIVAAARTLPFASSFRLIIVDGVENLSTSARDTLTAYALDPSPTSVVAFVGQKMPKTLKLYKAVVDKGAVLDRKAPDRKRLPFDVKALFEQRGLKANSETIAALINAVGENLDVLSASVYKLRLYVGKRKTVNVDDVAAVIAPTAEVKIWDYTQALADKRGAQALERLDAALRVQGNTVVGAMVFAERTQRDLLSARALIERGTPSSARLAAALGKPEWLARKTMKQAERFTGKELRSAYTAWGEMLEASRSGGPDRLLFEMWIARFCSGSFS